MAGLLHTPDPEAAAEQFLGLLVEPELVRPSVTAWLNEVKEPGLASGSLERWAARTWRGSGCAPSRCIFGNGEFSTMR